MIKECPECGKEYFEGQNYCKECGEELKELDLGTFARNDIKKLIKQDSLSAKEVLEEERNFVEWLEERVDEES